MRTKNLERQLFILGLFLPIAGILLWSVYIKITPSLPLAMQTCLWDQWFGIYCPGCGGTRAIKSLLGGNILKAVWYHPLVVYGISIYLLFMVSHLISFLTSGRRRGLIFRAGYLYTAIGILVFNFLIKNLLRQIWGITLG